jgi:hypothetical protein
VYTDGKSDPQPSVGECALEGRALNDGGWSNRLVRFYFLSMVTHEVHFAVGPSVHYVNLR